MRSRDLPWFTKLEKKLLNSIASPFSGKVVRLGAGAGFSGDRIDPAADLARSGAIDYLVFECLAERTIGLAQQLRASDPDAGYDLLLEARMRAVLAECFKRGVRIISNLGAANPQEAARKVASVGRELGLAGLKVAAVLGDDVMEHVSKRENDVSANVYLGAEPIVSALAQGAHVVITGRVSDAALFMAPLVHEYKWGWADWDRLGRAALVGHLLECAGQVCGGYFADTHHKQVPRLAELGFPIGTVNSDGDLMLSKLPGTGGRISVASCTEQLLYEVHDPCAYIQPDVVADFGGVSIEAYGDDAVVVRGGKGKPRPETLKASICYDDGYIGEGQMSYGGSDAVDRGQLALDIVRDRLALRGAEFRELRYDLIGVNSLSGADLKSMAMHPALCEVRIRVSGRSDDVVAARQIGDEVEALYTNGPAGGGGASKTVRQVLAVRSDLVQRQLVQPTVQWF